MSWSECCRSAMAFSTACQRHMMVQYCNIKNVDRMSQILQFTASSGIKFIFDGSEKIECLIMLMILVSYLCRNEMIVRVSFCLLFSNQKGVLYATIN